LWTERLAKYPRWKLDKLGEYTGPLSNKVFEYLDGIFSRQTETYESPREEQGYKKQLPDHKDYSKLERECGKKLLHGISEILQDENIQHRDHKQKISELNARLREEYPMFSANLRS
jgi:hypothetical protein